MANRFVSPFPQFFDSTPNVRSSGTLEFFAAGTSTPLAVYSDSALSASLGTTITLNALGQPPSGIFLQNLGYKVILKDSSANIIWTEDNVFASDFSTTARFSSGNGSPIGVRAGTAGSATTSADSYFDFAAHILYVCTTTGTASTAVWTAINASSAAAIVPPSQGYLTLTSSTPVISGDVTAATAIYYTPYVGNVVPVYNGTSYSPTVFSELMLTLTSSQAASTIYDVFVFNNSGILTLVTGPAWTNSAAGTGARGAGAGTSALTRISGFWVNSVQITGRNAANSYTIPANQATYLGSIVIDGAAGQTSCYRSWGAARSWGVWNAYNRQRLTLIGGDATASWTYALATIRGANGSVGNKVQTFVGLPEETIYASEKAEATIALSAPCTIGLGLNSTTAFSGTPSATATAAANGLTSMFGQLIVPPGSIGINSIQALEQANGSQTVTFYGTQTTMNIMAQWNG